MCGITDEELQHYFPQGIDSLGNELGLEKSATLDMLKENYDGYRFCQVDFGLYNPYSLLQAFSSLEIDNYWSYSGAPKFLVQLIREKGWYLDDIDNSCLPKDYLSLPDTAINDPLPLMFQTGYLTIKGYDSDMQEFYWHIQIKR
ncbi:MAG: AAA family ATPase [Muribaculaceae bacterium]